MPNFDSSAMSCNVKVLFFAKARELSGEKESQMTVQRNLTYNSLFERIINEFSLSALEKCAILAINEEYYLDGRDVHLEDGDVIAVIPPLSGG